MVSESKRRSGGMKGDKAEPKAQSQKSAVRLPMLSLVRDRSLTPKTERQRIQKVCRHGKPVLSYHRCRPCIP